MSRLEDLKEELNYLTTYGDSRYQHRVFSLMAEIGRRERMGEKLGNRDNSLKVPFISHSTDSFIRYLKSR